MTLGRRPGPEVVDESLFAELESWRRQLAACARRHDLIAVRFLVPELEAPAHGGLVRVRDPRSGHRALVDWRSPGVRARYAARVTAWRSSRTLPGQS